MPFEDWGESPVELCREVPMSLSNPLALAMLLFIIGFMPIGALSLPWRTLLLALQSPVDQPFLGGSMPSTPLGEGATSGKKEGIVRESIALNCIFPRAYRDCRGESERLEGEESLSPTSGRGGLGIRLSVCLR